jgi:hypothetical protein
MPSIPPYRICATRALKNAKFLQRVAPRIMPPPVSVLAQLHRPERRSALLRDPQLARLLKTIDFPASGNTAVDPRFSGTLFFARIQLTIQNQNNAVLSVSAADVQTAIQYATLASLPISEYAAQYGPNDISVSQSLIDFATVLPSATYNDTQLQGWVNQIASQNNLSSNSCVVVLSPTSLINTNGNWTQGVGGYHGLANVPYIFVNVFGQNLTVQDANFAYAQILSHEIAEMVVDPLVDGRNPEVCDGCGPNCQSVYLDFFDNVGAYIQTLQSFPPSFSYNFFINAIVQPSAATQCPAPGSSCAYAPASLFMSWKGVEGDEGIWFSTDFGSGWAPQAKIQNVGTSFRPALAAYNFFDSFTRNSLIHMAWKGIDNDQGIYFIKFDGNPQQLVPGVGTSVGPSLAAYNGLLYMAWKGIDGDQGIYFATFDGQNWAPQQNVTGVGTSVGPALLAAFPLP